MDTKAQCLSLTIDIYIISHEALRMSKGLVCRRQHEELTIDISFNFIYSGCEANKNSQREKRTTCSQEPNREKTRTEVSVLDVGGKPQRFIPGENPRSQVGTKTQTHGGSACG